MLCLTRRSIPFAKEIKDTIAQVGGEVGRQVATAVESAMKGRGTVPWNDACT